MSDTEKVYPFTIEGFVKNSGGTIVALPDVITDTDSESSKGILASLNRNSQSGTENAAAMVEVINTLYAKGLLPQSVMTVETDTRLLVAELGNLMILFSTDINLEFKVAPKADKFSAVSELVIPTVE